MHVHGVTIIMTQRVNKNELILRTLITTKFLIFYYPDSQKNSNNSNNKKKQFPLTLGTLMTI